MENRTKGKAYKPKRPFKTVEGLGSTVWMRLSRHAAYVLDRFYAKFNGYNRDNLSLTYGEVKNKMSNKLFTPALWELMGYGFIDRIRPGRLERECSVYRLSNRWRKLENEPNILDEIEQLLSEIKKVMSRKGCSEKRQEINRLRNALLTHSEKKRG